VPKPLINIDGKPIIAYVIDMFQGETDFLFICNQSHLDNPVYKMREILGQYCPSGKVVGISPHRLGPVHSVCQVEQLVNATQPVIVNYCDFSCFWNWGHFKRFVEATKCTGCMPAFRGFHPHCLGSTFYAYMREVNGWVWDIQEKQPYTSDRMSEYASSGTYYFKSGEVMRKAFRHVVEQNLSVGGEYYVSLAYKSLLEAGDPVALYEIQHYLAWGTPEDVAEYRTWSNAFRRLLDRSCRSVDPSGSVVMSMAGLGQRFQVEGYPQAKPLIPVFGKPMVAQATLDLPPAEQHAFVLRSDMAGYSEIAATLKVMHPQGVVESVSSVTEGQACTALLGLEALERQFNPLPEPVTFGACDYGSLYDAKAFEQLTRDPKIDVIVWGVRGHANAARCPALFGWVDATQDGKIRRISVKAALGSPATDPIVVGAFTFRRAADFRDSVNRLISRNVRVNNEYYLDAAINEAINLGLNCHLFEIDNFLCWGTPDDLKTFEYWQSCFHKWDGHPYSLNRDARIEHDSLGVLVDRFKATIPPLPGPHVGFGEVS
jgi:NDP-sugar pyrophosphorylase family protein